MTLGDISGITAEILTESASNLVNRGPLAELVAGLEMQRYQTPNLRHQLYYWLRAAKNSEAEVDYVESIGARIIPIEVKGGMKGGMKSLWIFIREKRLEMAVRCSLENFGGFEYRDEAADGAIRRVTICPLYAMSRLRGLLY